MSRPIKLFIMRHSLSCANRMRHAAGTEDRDHPLVAASQAVLDPELTENGKQMARAYGPKLTVLLESAGFDLNSALFGASGLRRAHSTAEALFPGRTVVHLPHIREFGDIPENRPRSRKTTRPDWKLFLRHLYELPQDQFVVVGHGSYLLYKVWPSVAQGAAHRRFSNLDGLLIEAELTQNGRLMRPRLLDVPHTGAKPQGEDRCAVHIERIIRRHRGTHRRQQRKSRRRKTRRLVERSK